MELKVFILCVIVALLLVGLSLLGMALCIRVINHVLKERDRHTYE